MTNQTNMLLNFSEFPVKSEHTFLGFSDSENQKVPLYIRNSDRTRHLYILGQTGIGKSVLIESLALQDISSGHGVCVFDPHGDLAMNILDAIPENRKNDVIFFDGANLSNDFSLNPFQIFSTNEAEQVEEKEQIAITLGEIMIEIFGADEFGPKLQDAFRNACLTLLDNKNSSFLDIPKIFSDEEFRKNAIVNLKNPIVKAFWEHIYEPMNGEEKGKIAYFFIEKFYKYFTPNLEKFLGNTDSIDFQKIISEKKIAIFSLTVGVTGMETAKFLSRIFLSRFQIAAEQVHSEENFYIYLDEFQFFKCRVMENLLVNGRRNHIAATVAHQFFAQMQNSFEEADNNDFGNMILGNVGSMIVGKIGMMDAELFRDIMGGVSAEDFKNLGNSEAYAKILENHEPQKTTKIQFLQKNITRNN